MTEIIFWLAVFWGGFSFAGYPIWMWLLARYRPLPTSKDDIRAPVALVIVGYNESTRIAAKLESCLQQAYPKELLRIIFASDGSQDGTVEIARGFTDRGVEVISFDSRRGKAACLNDVAAICEEPFLVFTDVRQRLHSDAVAMLVANFADTTVGAVSGEIVFENENSSEFAEGVSFYWRYERALRDLEAKSGSAVGVSGALYAIRRECFAPIPHGTILDDVMIPMRAVIQGWRVLFDRDAVAYDRPTTEAAQEKIRKIRTLAGNFQLITLLPEVLSPWANPIFFRFFWHKIARLFMPVCLFAALLANGILATHSTFYLILLILHTGLYLLPLATMLWRPLGRLRVVRICVAMLWLNAFVVLGFRAFLRSRDVDIWGQTNR